MLREGDQLKSTPVVLGHRGASADASENTVEAYRLALDQGADGVELDVRVSADGALVLHHNPTLDDGRHIHEVVRSELPPSMPTLTEALDALVGSLVNIEIKNLPHEPSFDPAEALVDAVAGLLAERNWTDNVILSSFYTPTIERFKAIAPEVPTAVLSWGFFALDSVEVAIAGGHQAIHPHVDSVTEDLIMAAHQRGLAVNTWTVDDPAQAVAFAAMGIDGIVTNVPRVLLRALRGGDDQSQRIRPVFEGE